MKDWTHILTHLGEADHQEPHPIVPPIVQSSNFAFPTVASFRAAFQDELGHHLYTRGNNPTVEILRKKLAALEGSEDALVVSSGVAAISTAILSHVQAGEHVICVQKPYAWTAKLLEQFLPKFGVSYTFVDGRSVDEIAQAIQVNTKVLMLESPNSLTFELQDLSACANLAKAHQITTIIDNSYCSPFFQNPIDFGIDIVVHSGTKYLNGHSDVVFGVICASRAATERMFKTTFMTLGPCISPHDAWLVLRSLRTLPIRMQQADKTTRTVIEYLKQSPKVAQVLYPLDETFPQYKLAQRQMRGAGGLFSVEFKQNDLQQMEAFCNSLAATFQFAVSWGGHEALQIPTCTFYNMPQVPPPPLPIGFVRYYIGLEEASFLIRAFEQALVNL